MQIFDTIKKTEYDTSVALGFFDGVHKGHQDVIRKAVAASSDACPATVVTFKNSPAAATGKNKPLLTTNEQKFELFKKLGVKVVFCIDFNDVKDMSAQEFVHDVLYQTLNAKCVVTGFNYHFSKGGKATADDMQKLCEPLGIDAIKCAPVMYNNEPVSSTRIRRCISDGDIESANDMLGYNFSIDNLIVSGNHLGTTLSSPTINQKLDKDIVTPRFGVYATKVTVNDTTYIGATNIGVHPTVGKVSAVCETHLLDFFGESLYNKRACTKLLKFIRAERKFESIDELKAQIEKDKKAIIRYFDEQSL
ncbi:MAG: bifunctional riboflavin kinase/FAD synthetase [Ruminococcaceae bacterium]|nr:bifunctional riboflavin kinase/FAD synthetase [Oscillospiraceae bacterium]